MADLNDGRGLFLWRLGVYFYARYLSEHPACRRRYVAPPCRWRRCRARIRSHPGPVEARLRSRRDLDIPIDRLKRRTFNRLDTAPSAQALVERRDLGGGD